MENSTLRRLSNDSAVLILGIFSIFFCCFMGVPGLASGAAALVLAGRSRKEFRQNPQAFDPDSLSQVNTGRICGIIGLILSSLVLLYFVFATVVAFTNPEVMEKIRSMQTD